MPKCGLTHDTRKAAGISGIMYSINQMEALPDSARQRCGVQPDRASPNL